MIVPPFQNERVFLWPKNPVSAKAFTARGLAVFGFTGTDFGIWAAVIHKFKTMETSTKMILLTAMYGLPLCLAFIYRINENIRMKQKRVTKKQAHNEDNCSHGYH